MATLQGDARKATTSASEETLAAALDQYFEAGATEVILTNTGLNGVADRRRSWKILGEYAADR